MTGPRSGAKAAVGMGEEVKKKNDALGTPETKENVNLYDPRGSPYARRKRDPWEKGLCVPVTLG